MAKLSVVACFLLLLAVSSATTGREGDQYERRHERRHQRRQDRRQQEQRFDDLEPRRPQEIFRSEGGRIEEWQPEDYPALCDAEVGARRVTLRQNGFAIPSYKDSPMIKVITRGRCRAGIIKPFMDRATERNTVFSLQKGDVIALPRGVASWFYNDDSEETEILEIADTTESPNCGRFRAFILGGGKQENKASVLHGFSQDMLAHAWDVEERTIEHMLEGRKGAAIIRVDEEKLHLPRQSSRRNTLFADFVYHLKDSAPDVNVRNAGQIRFLNSFKLPILRNINLGAMCVEVEQGAMVAPAWIHNAHNVIYVEGGRGRVQIVRENGEQALDTEVERGQLVIIPANFPSVKRAEEREGFRYVGVVTNDRHVRTNLAGRSSVYQGMPHGVLAASFQADERVLRELEETRRDEDYLFPPRRQSRREDRDSSLEETLAVM